MLILTRRVGETLMIGDEVTVTVPVSYTHLDVYKRQTRGCLARSDAGICVAISGIAGPGGGSEEKPVGTVWFAWADRTGRHHSLLARFDGDRHQVRQQAVRQALSGLLALLK